MKCRHCRLALHGTRPVDTQVRVALIAERSFWSPRTFFVQEDRLNTWHLTTCYWYVTIRGISVNVQSVCSNYQPNAHFLYSLTIYMLHYNPQHVSSSTLLIFRRANCINTASGIVTLCEQPYNMQVESGIGLLSTCILYGCSQCVTIPEAVIIQSVLLKMSKVLLETCWGL